MIKLTFPGIKQSEFEDAFNVLNECIVTELPCLGFEHPFMGPGGAYGQCWWERDSILTLSGYRWLDPKFAERALSNFCAVQKPNGRIPLWGHDRVREYDIELSAVPVIFEVGLKILKSTTDQEYIRKIYNMLVRYMDWWLSDVKRDRETGLVTGIFEESDPCDVVEPQTVAQVDLNVQICVGADVLAEIAEYLGDTEAVRRYRQIFADMRERINTYLYCPEDGAYYSYMTREKRLRKEQFYSSMFDTFKRKILPGERAEGLLRYLTDDRYFNFHAPYGLTTMAKTCPEYVETVGPYQDNPSWKGNVWTMRNETIATGLREYGLNELSSHVVYQTVMEFNNNYAEFLSPSTGQGHGVLRYGWSAAQYIQLIIEEIFGIHYNAWKGGVQVTPNLPPELYGQDISIQNVALGDGRYLHVRIACSETPEIHYTITERQQ